MGFPILEKHKKSLTTAHTALHCMYWADAAITHVSLLYTPVYGCLAVLTIFIHLLNEDKE